MTWVVLALEVLLAGMAISSFLCHFRASALAAGLGAILIAGSLCVFGAFGALSGNPAEVSTFDWPLPLGNGGLVLDALSAWFLVLPGIVGTASAVYSWGYFGGGRAPGFNRSYAPLFCVMFAAMILVFCAADVIVFLVGWEMMSLSAFFLVGINDQESEARHGAWMYLVATHLGTALGVLPVFGAFVARSGGTQMHGFAETFGPTETWACVALFALGVVGFGAKAGFMPFHVWLPVAHPVAPSPISALMSGVVIKAGIYGLLRLVSWLPELPVTCGAGLIALSLATGLLGILYALGQRQLKRMLAYSSVENIGIIGLAIGVALLGRSLHYPVLAAFGLGGALLHTLNHSLFKGLLFMSAGAVLHGTGTDDIERLGGLARAGAMNCFAFLAGTVAICALPPLNGFVSEYLIYNGLLGEVRNLPLVFALLLALSAAVLALIGGIALAVFSKVFSTVFLGHARDNAIHVHPTPQSMNAGMFLLIAACVCVVVLPGAVVPALSTAMAPVMTEAFVPAHDLQAAVARTASLSLPFTVFMALSFGLFALRRCLPRGAWAIGEGRTWSCGYAGPSASMQYSGSSYGWKLLWSFKTLIRPQRRAPKVAGCFPVMVPFETDMPDLVLSRVYQPLFRRFPRFCERLWPLQHGRIQLYLVYIVLTLLFVFFVEAWQTPAASPEAAPHRVNPAHPGVPVPYHVTGGP